MVMGGKIGTHTIIYILGLKARGKWGFWEREDDLLFAIPKKGKPRFSNLQAVTQAMGLTLTVELAKAG
jgi:hypothetical protein